MQQIKSTILTSLGIIALIFFMAMSYIHNALFLDRIIVCSIILGIVFFAKMRNENKGYSNTDGTKYMDQI